MKDFTVKGILEFSRNIEMESYNFYENAKPVFESVDLKELAEELAQEEMKHYNKFNMLLENTKLSQEELDEKVSISKEHHDMLVATREIPENATALSILETAYQREKNTESIYRSLNTLTNISDDVIKTFGDLMEQEQGHANRIQSLMKKYQ